MGMDETMIQSVLQNLTLIFDFRCPNRMAVSNHLSVAYCCVITSINSSSSSLLRDPRFGQSGCLELHSKKQFQFAAAVLRLPV